MKTGSSSLFSHRVPFSVPVSVQRPDVRRQKFEVLWPERVIFVSLISHWLVELIGTKVGKTMPFAPSPSHQHFSRWYKPFKKKWFVALFYPHYSHTPMRNPHSVWEAHGDEGPLIVVWIPWNNIRFLCASSSQSSCCTPGKTRSAWPFGEISANHMANNI